MNYSDLKLTIPKFTNNFTIGENTINVYQYVSIEDKYDLINAVVQNSEENGIFNPLLVDMYFNLYLVYMYTDIIFTEEEKAEPSLLYDHLDSNGIIRAVINNMNPNEYKCLVNMAKRMVGLKQTYKRTIASVLHEMIDDLPDKTEKAAGILK
jgi:hypothetical protein